MEKQKSPRLDRAKLAPSSLDSGRGFTTANHAKEREFFVDRRGIFLQKETKETKDRRTEIRVQISVEKGRKTGF